MSIFGGGNDNEKTGKIFKLFDSDDNKYSIELKLKIETEKAAVRKYEQEAENFSIGLSAVKNNIGIVRRALDFLKSNEAKIVILNEYATYAYTLPKLYREEKALIASIKAANEAIKKSTDKIEELEQSVLRLKTKIIPFRKDNETRSKN